MSDPEAGSNSVHLTQKCLTGIFVLFVLTLQGSNTNHISTQRQSLKVWVVRVFECENFKQEPGNGMSNRKYCGLFLGPLLRPSFGSNAFPFGECFLEGLWFTAFCLVNPILTFSFQNLVPTSFCNCYCCCCLKIYLHFESQSSRERQRHLLSSWLQWPGLGQT